MGSHLYLWGDLLGEGPNSAFLRSLLPALSTAFDGIEARRFWPRPEDEPPEGKRVCLSTGSTRWEVRTRVGESELRRIREAVAGTVPAGSPVLALAGPEEDPTARIHADIPYAGRILLLDHEASYGPPRQTVERVLRAIVSGREERRIALRIRAELRGGRGRRSELEAFLKGLEHCEGIEVELRPLDRDPPAPESLPRRIREACFRSLEAPRVAIHFCSPKDFRKDPEVERNILRCRVAGGGFPEAWIPRMKEADGIWVRSGFERRLFASRGIPPERLRILPEAVDTELFDPETFPSRPFRSRNLAFLAVLPWEEHEAPEILCKAFGRAFAEGEAVLRLRIKPGPGDSISRIQARALECVEEGAVEAGHPPPTVHFHEESEDDASMAALLADSDAFVSCGRYDSWPRPRQEAMAMALPVLTTLYGGAQDLCHGASTVVPIAGRVVPVSTEDRVRDPRLHLRAWLEPDLDHLSLRLREVADRFENHAVLGKQARRRVVRWFHPIRIARVATRLLEESLDEGSDRSPAARLFLALGGEEEGLVDGGDEKRLLVRFEGPVFESSSYATIQRNLARALARRGDLEIRLRPTTEPGRNIDQDRDLLPLLAPKPRIPDAVVRSGWPVPFAVPDAGVWIQRFDWEYGPPPREIAGLFQNGPGNGTHAPDEIWVHSGFVRANLLAAGIEADRIHLIPHGIDKDLLNPRMKPLRVIAERVRGRYAFLFVGGAIPRKGLDLLARAWLQAFRAEDPVVLLVKTGGGNGVYAGQGLEEIIRKAAAHPAAAEIHLIEEDFGDLAMSGLYAAADCLVHPYRGEGFGMPVLEAMACGLPVIVTAGGATEDFVGDRGNIKISSRRIRASIPEICAGRPWLLEPDVHELARAMQVALAGREALRLEAAEVAREVAAKYSWDEIAKRVSERIHILTGLVPARRVERTISS